jgi:hypothetical protein
MADQPRDPDSDGAEQRPDDPAAPAMPRWVKVFAIIPLVLAVLVVIALLTGGHGPSRHMSITTAGFVPAGNITTQRL